MNKIEQTIEFLKDMETSLKHLNVTLDRYRGALRQIQQVGINCKDPVDASTVMTEIARKALE